MNHYEFGHSESQRETARMMAIAGLKPHDIAVALGVSELQVRAWFKCPPEPDDTPPRAA